MSRGHHVETPTQHQVHSVATNVARGRDVLAALAAAWSSSAHQLDPAGADDAPTLHADNESKQKPQPTTVRGSR